MDRRQARRIRYTAFVLKEKKQTLDEELEEYKEYAQQLEQELKQFIVEGGTFTWTSEQS